MSTFLTRAKVIVYDYAKDKLEKTDKHVTFGLEDVYVVWFAKTLQNWKALLSTTLPDGKYYEVTYDGDRKVAYLDTYIKFDNVAIPDDTSSEAQEEAEQLTTEKLIDQLTLPHSRACGTHAHAHGLECHTNYPTCTRTEPHKERISVNLDVKQYERKPFHVLGVQVTTENLADVALWCDGKVMHDVKDGDSAQVPFVKVDVRRPLHERQTRAYVGDWVLRAGQGFRVYNDGAFLKSFDVEHPRPTVPAPRSETPKPGPVAPAISPGDLALLAKVKQELSTEA